MIGKHACLLYRLMFNIADETHITNVLYCVSWKMCDAIPIGSYGSKLNAV